MGVGVVSAERLGFALEQRDQIGNKRLETLNAYDFRSISDRIGIVIGEARPDLLWSHQAANSIGCHHQVGQFNLADLCHCFFFRNRLPPDAASRSRPW